MKKLCAIIAAFTALLMFATTALAETWYLEDGDVVVVGDDSGNRHVTQGEKSQNETTETIITQRENAPATGNTITISGGTDAAPVEVTVEDVNIELTNAGNDVGILVKDGNAEITLEGENTITGADDNDANDVVGVRVTDTDASEDNPSEVTIQSGDTDGTLNIENVTSGIVAD